MGYAQDEIILRTDFACHGILVLSERTAPGWQASLDGEPVDVLQANYLLRAVAVPAGQHTVHLRYRPPSYLWGLAISLSALVLFCALLGFNWKRWCGAAIIGIAVPALAILWFGKPFQEPPAPAERWVEVDTPERPSLIPNPQEARLQDEQGEMAFLGYEVDRTVLAPGDTLRLTLYWRGEAAVGRDYTVFTHLLDDEGRRWAQKDQPPVNGKAPTTSWQEGQIVADIYHLVVSPDAPVTAAHLAIGMYDWQTGERVPMFDMDGNQLENDTLLLNVDIQIQP